MNTTKDTKPSPIEVWLGQRNITVACTVVHEDETTDTVKVASLSMRGAQREVTGHFLREGYEPVGRWESTLGITSGFSAALMKDKAECVRHFRLKAS
jgi:hypothetical protein